MDFFTTFTFIKWHIKSFNRVISEDGSRIGPRRPSLDPTRVETKIFVFVFMRKFSQKLLRKQKFSRKMTQEAKMQWNILIPRGKGSLEECSGPTDPGNVQNQMRITTVCKILG
jgi:hypothetical protein